MKNLIPAFSPLASDISNHQPSGCFWISEVRVKRPEVSRSFHLSTVRPNSFESFSSRKTFGEAKRQEVQKQQKGFLSLLLFLPFLLRFFIVSR
ncbi:MAG: hypothetical protein ABI977_02575 [Acidobacteriota bacterium]